MGALIRTLLVALSLTAVVVAIAGWAGVRYGLHQAEQRPSLDSTLHRELQLTGDQNHAIDALEGEYAHNRRTLTVEMSAANHDLAEAIAADHAYTPRVQKAVDRFHAAMSELQKRTIEHVLSMRSVLTRDQASRFDQEIAKALSGPS